MRPSKTSLAIFHFNGPISPTGQVPAHIRWGRTHQQMVKLSIFLRLDRTRRHREEVKYDVVAIYNRFCMYRFQILDVASF